MPEPNPLKAPHQRLVIASMRGIGMPPLFKVCLPLTLPRRPPPLPAIMCTLLATALVLPHPLLINPLLVRPARRAASAGAPDQCIKWRRLPPAPSRPANADQVSEVALWHVHVPLPLRPECKAFYMLTDMAPSRLVRSSVQCVQTHRELKRPPWA